MRIIIGRTARSVYDIYIDRTLQTMLQEALMCLQLQTFVTVLVLSAGLDLNIEDTTSRPEMQWRPPTTVLSLR